MNILIEKNSQYGLVVSSRVIAKELGKQHNNVVRDIENILNSESSNLSSLIIPSTYKVSTQKRNYKEYLLTKDGFTLYMFNIQGYNDFKMAYIRKFNEMEKMIYSGKQLPINYGIDLVERKRDYCVIPFEQRLENTKEMVKLLTREIDDEINKIERSLLLLKDHKAHIKLYMLQI